MFDKILIANRGEIACRIITSARKMGVKSVAVYSDADTHSKHVSLADQAVHIGPSPVADSYLQADRIIQAALDTGAQAIHPGYGFLSENPDFVRKVEAAGLTFIGPSAAAIDAMGLKDAAKSLMVNAGVPVVPGYQGESQDIAFLAQEADKIGYPILIKARAGGGGKGMRLVENAADFKEEFEAAQREGQSSFGDPVCLIEKYISHPRHVEIQIFGDSHGNVVHLFERDCSLQRRYQKVIEEAPAPDMPADVRAAMGQAAVKAAKAVGYEGAGTVEFIVDGSDGLKADGFWFMEMNTRLQVEHPVTEAITGLDLVALQLRVAAGDPLPFAQDDLTIDGWAFEARIYAEDVPKGFLPAIGTLEHLTFPDGQTFENGSVRIDSGIRAGDDISPFYDPMIAKVIVHGPDRATALKMLTAALAGCHVGGATTNIGFLSALSKHAGFQAGNVDTHLIARDLDALVATEGPSDHIIAAASVMSLGLAQQGSDDPWQDLANWRQWSNATYTSRVSQGDDVITRRIEVLPDRQFMVDDALTFGMQHKSGTQYVLHRNGIQDTIDMVVHGHSIFIFHEGCTSTFETVDPLAVRDNVVEGGDNLFAPMPGLVTIVTAKPGQSVAEGDSLIVLEAMKMEHTLRAPRDGIIAEVLAQPGTQVVDGDLLLQLEPEDA
jgi:3-methylcrotonyl-CoA carboxylase alpha subunit